MRKLSKELKRILTGLAYQDAGEFLTMHGKMKVLGYGPEIKERTKSASRKVAERRVTKRIALISDGGGLGAPLDYAIDVSLRQGARIDLLIHGAIGTERISVLEKRVQQAGVECQRVQLGVKVIDGIVAYICNHPSLIFVVAIADDYVARALIEEVIPHRGGRIPVPLVLIEDQAATQKYKRSAA